MDSTKLGSPFYPDNSNPREEIIIKGHMIKGHMIKGHMIKGHMIKGHMIKGQAFC